MSAIINPPCGHTMHLMEVDRFNGSPQLHLHFLTEPEEHAFIGYMKVELCCHGCGYSMLIYFNESDVSAPRHLALKDSFEGQHKLCPNRNYEALCPNYRSRFDVIDMRRVRKRKKTIGQVTHPVRAGPVPHPGPGVVGDGRTGVRKTEAES